MMHIEPPDQKFFEAARGYAELGMFYEANEQLEKIDPFLRAVPEILALRIEIYRGLEKWELMTELTRRLTEVEPENPQWPVSLGITTTFDVTLGFAIHIMSMSDVAFHFPIRAHDDPKFPRFNVRATQSRANDWNVILSADRACVEPVKRDLSWWTDRFCCGRAEGTNKIFFGRPARSDLINFLLCDRVARHCLTR